MGLTYKVLKHRNIELDLSQSSRSKTVKSERLESESLDKSPFTAEHIIQLCRFLAEKSQAKKNRERLQNMQQQHYQHVDYPNTLTEYETNETVMRAETPTLSPSHVSNNRTTTTTTTLSDDIQMTSTTAATTTTTIKSTATQVLLDKLSRANHNNNNHNIAPHFAAASIQQKPPLPQFQLQQQLQLHQQPHHHQQDKREILLKIRQQIFERKRLRQLVRVQRRLTADVWRPW